MILQPILAVSLAGVWSTFQTEILFAAYIVIAIYLINVMIKKSFIQGFITLLGMSLVMLFIQAPQRLNAIGSWLGGLLGI